MEAMDACAEPLGFSVAVGVEPAVSGPYRVAAQSWEAVASRTRSAMWRSTVR